MYFYYLCLFFFFFFFFNDTATTEIYTLSLHDALPISPPRRRSGRARRPTTRPRWPAAPWWGRRRGRCRRRSRRTTSRCPGRSSCVPPHGVRVGPAGGVVALAQPDHGEPLARVERVRGLVVGAHFEEDGGVRGVGDLQQLAQHGPADATALVGGVDAERGVTDQRLVDPGGDVVVARPQLLPEGLRGPGVVAREEHPLQLGAARGVRLVQRAERDGHSHTFTR